MFELFLFLLVIVLLFFLSKAAGIAVANVKKICTTFHLPLFFVGIVLGLVTSLPEFALGINAVATNILSVSFGNLFGSSLVLFGLIFGLGLILERGVKTDGQIRHILPILAYLFLPFLFGASGGIDRFESMILIALYPCILYFLFRQHSSELQTTKKILFKERFFAKECFFIIISFLLIALISGGIIQITHYLLQTFNVKGFLIGLFLFAIGTNLPELTVMIRSWRSNIPEFSLNHLIGSVIVDPLLIGIFSFIRPYQEGINLVFLNMTLFTALLFLAFAYFYKTDKKFTREEGFILFTIYLAFAMTNIGLALKN